MNSNRLKEIGVIVKPHSYKGAVVIRLHRQNSEDFETVRSLFLLIEGRAVPFMVESADAVRTDTLIVSFNGYGEDEKMAGFIGCPVLAENQGEGEGVVHDGNILVGFSLFDESGRFRGTIVSVAERKHQWLADVSTDSGKNFMLPVHEDLIMEYDEEDRRIVIAIPEGIEDLG
jgi:16S rRNA processing protein RimM